MNFQASKEVFRKDIVCHHRGEQVAENILPLLAMRFDPMTVHTVHHQMRHFMHVGDQEKIGMKVSIDSDVRGLARATDEVAYFGLAALSQCEAKRVIRPKVVAICPGCFGNVKLDNGGNFFRGHTNKKGLYRSPYSWKMYSTCEVPGHK